MMKAIRAKTNEADTPTTKDPAPLGDNESGHSSVLLGSLYGQLMEGTLPCVKLYNC